jgi:hypothetical protein
LRHQERGKEYHYQEEQEARRLTEPMPWGEDNCWATTGRAAPAAGRRLSGAIVHDRHLPRRARP